jgi:hypothetical protein
MIDADNHLPNSLSKFEVVDRNIVIYQQQQQLL